MLCPCDSRITLGALISRLCSLLHLPRQDSVSADVEFLAKQQEQLIEVALAIPERLNSLMEEFRAKPTIVVVRTPHTPSPPPFTVLCPLNLTQYGQSGSGKSTFLNALLGENFFTEGQSGQVGTHCITQLEHGARLRAVIEWMTADDWRSERGGGWEDASSKSVAEVIATKAKVPFNVLNILRNQLKS